jgi:glycosyltransferase involved in cell wall biosynthesis
MAPAPKAKGRVLFLITEDWYFWLHRLPLARAVRDAGYEVLIATHIADHGGRIEEEGFRLIPIQLSRSSRNVLSELLAILEIARIYRREKPDIVHHVALKPILYGSWAAGLAGRRVVINAFAGLGFVFTGTGAAARRTRSIIAAFLRTAFWRDAAVAVFQNGDDFETLRSHGVVRSPCSTIIRGSGVDEREFVLSAEPEGKPLVLLPARMLWDKGIGEFVAAATMLRERGVDARFVLAGRRDPSNPSSIPEEQLERWRSEGAVEWWGQRDDMPGVIAMSHIVALPSYREGLPKVLLEAAACGRPVVATDVPGCREIVKHGENGFLVPLRDAGALAEALLSLIRDSALRRNMGERGREMVMREFTVEHISRQFLDVYERLLSGKGLAAAR